jgi:alpha-L-rhamnosidase
MPKSIFIGLIILLFSPLTALLAETTQLTVKQLRCEHLENPLGIDSPNPRLSWRMSDADAGTSQAAWQILVDTDSLSVVDGAGEVWDSKKVSSDEMLTRFSGQPLEPFTKYYWSVAIWDTKGGKFTSGIASFETGMANQDNWKGNWISDTHDYNVKPAPYFRKAFSLDKSVKEARAYIVVAGLYELTLNGKKVGDHRLDPMYTRFDRRNLYVTHDITHLLNDGPNAVGVLLGNGWYNHQSSAVWYFDKAPWRARPKFCMDIRVVYDDGSRETITTGADWKTTHSPVIFNSIYTAEHYDAREEIPGWDKPGFDDSGWRGAMLTGTPSKNIVSQTMVPVRNVQEIAPEELIRINDHTYLFDFGQNMSGVTKIKLKGQAGTTVRLKHGERLDDNGRVDMSNIDVHYRPIDDTDPFQTDILILSGKKEDVFMPRFNYKGFQ